MKAKSVTVGPTTLCALANRVLLSADPEAKIEASRAASRAWLGDEVIEIGNELPPRRPARPDRPELRPPRAMPRRGHGGSHNNRAALINAIAHIEFNAVDLAWDIISRFAGNRLPRQFYDDWVEVEADETSHFLALQRRLSDFGSSYGALPAHDGLWEAAEKTSGDLLFRLAIVPLVLEARGLDVTPPMIVRLRSVGDDDTANILAVQLEDEVKHVATGHRWFQFVCERNERDPRTTFHDKVASYGMGALKAPFNESARDAAGLPRGYYLPLALV